MMSLRQHAWHRAPAAMFVAFSLAGCSSSTSTAPGSDASTLCVAGESIACTGPHGCASQQVCLSDGQGYEACKCGPQTDASTTRDASPDSRVGDGSLRDRGSNDDASDTRDADFNDGAPRDDAAGDTESGDGASAEAGVGNDTGTQDAGPADSTSSDASPGDTGAGDSTLGDAAPHDGSATDATPGDSGADDGASDSALGDAGSSVTCTFASVDSTAPMCAIASPPDGDGLCYVLPASYTVTQSNVPVYIDGTPGNYVVVVDAPNVFQNFNGATHTFSLTASATVSGELVGQPPAFIQILYGTFTGGVTIIGSQAAVDLSGSRMPPQDCVGAATQACLTQTLTCTGTAVALLSNCATNNGGCSPNATCTWTGPTTNSCACNTGFTGDGGSCTANTFVNPCLTNNGGCDPNATCTEEPAGDPPMCTCNAGYAGNGVTCDPL